MMMWFYFGFKKFDNRNYVSA